MAGLPHAMGLCPISFKKSLSNEKPPKNKHLLATRNCGL